MFGRGAAEGSAAPRALLVAAGLVTVGFHLWLVFSGLIPNLVSRPLHMALALLWVFYLSGPGRTLLETWAGRLLGAAAFLTCLAIAWRHDALADQYGSLEGGFQLALAVLLILAALEMARRAIKAALPIAAAVALAYGLFGSWIPGELGHPGLPLESFLGTLTIAEGGLWGELTGVSVDTVAIFVILGSAVSAGEGGRAFMSLAVFLAGRLRAGAAKVAVLSSAFFGSISGSASANVASTGAVTLPAMKRLGYPAPFAAAVEAVASSGGQIMPPLMGAGAFIMVELLHTSYAAIMAAAILPAILFFVAAWIGVDRFARRLGLEAMRGEEIPAGALVLRLLPFFALPFGVLLALLFGSGFTPQYAAAVAAFAAAALLLVDETWRPSLPRWGARLSDGVIEASRQIAGVAAIILCASLVIGVLNQTGLGVKITSMIVGLSGGELWMALLLTALACLILGMEVPTTAAYVICVSVAGPALIELGLPPLAAHLFVFWYALLSTITPPVCGTVFIAAGMAGAPWTKVADRAMRLGLGLYIVPLAFIANQALIDPQGQPLLAAWAFVKIGAGLGLISAGVIGPGKAWLRPLLIAAGLAAIFLVP